ncbi:thioredoxin [Candidatus Wolfebacteria bacterium]|nr:thioredoxin [Candidatus Wolfebacteria bacterium]
MSNLILTDENFSEKVLKSQKPILVDFWAEWCMPCQMIAPILQEIAEKFNEKIIIGKLDVDKNPSISNMFSIDAIPALFLFKDGKIIQKFIGVQPKQVIEKAIEVAIED